MTSIDQGLHFENFNSGLQGFMFFPPILTLRISAFLTACRFCVGFTRHVNEHIFVSVFEKEVKDLA